MTSSLPITRPAPRAAKAADLDELPMPSAFARTLRTFAEREKLDLAYTPLSLVEEPKATKGPAPAGKPLTAGISSTKQKETKVEEPVAPEPVNDVEPAKAQAQPMSNGLLTRGWAWLKRNNKFTAAKQLRVAETVSLGEKRFVSLIQVDGQKFLIGGGSQGVTLLTQLNAAETAGNALEALAKAGEPLK